MARKVILVPTDFSTASDAALPHAEALARQSSAELLVLHVLEPPLAYGTGELYYGPPEPDSDVVRAMLDAVKPADPGVTCRHRLAMGDPAGEILRIAAEEGAEMIVLGTHGRTGLSRMLMGSVAEAVVRRASCPVLVYRAAAGAVADRRGHALHL